MTTDFTFDPGTTWHVTATAGEPTGGIGAAVPTGGTSWTCTPVDATTAVCTLPALPAHSSATLHASVLVSDDSLDGVRNLGIKVSAGVTGGTRASTTLIARLASTPAVIATSDAAPGSVVGAVESDSSTVLLVPVENTGGTTAHNVTLRVKRPADLPDGVTLSLASAPATYWTCQDDGDALLCTAPAILPRSHYPLPLRVTVPALAGAITPITDVDLSTALSVVAPRRHDGLAPLTVQSAPGLVSVDLTSPTSVDAGLDSVVGASMKNVGGTTLRNVGAQVDLPDGVTVTDLGVSPGWTCEPANGGADCTVASLAPGASTRLSLGLRAAGTATGELTFTVDGAPAPAVSTLDVMLPDLRISLPAHRAPGNRPGSGRRARGHGHALLRGHQRRARHCRRRGGHAHAAARRRLRRPRQGRPGCLDLRDHRRPAR